MKTLSNITKTLHDKTGATGKDLEKSVIMTHYAGAAIIGDEKAMEILSNKYNQL